MCSTLPDLHIAITGIEKVVETLNDVLPLLSLLTRSATGQAISTYFNMITHPRQLGEKDGPKAVHLVLLDNGRSEAFADEELRQTLQCIRCGACMNHCPVYTRIGGHAYGTVYSGPIGQIVSPHLLGLQATKDLPTASSLCGACEVVCPVGIPIPKLLLRLRKESVKPSTDVSQTVQGQGAGRKSIEAGVWQLWALVHKSPRLYRLSTKLLTRLSWLMPKKLGPWTVARTAPKPCMN
jgi:L-lactate dehydrogenase complex protein LldF